MSFPSFSFFSQLAPSDGEMMNRSNSAEPSVPSFMSFVGLQPNNTQKPHLWDWETVSIGTPQLLPTIQNQPHFFDSTSHLPPPMGSFPFHSDTVKRQERGIGGIGLDLGHRTYFPAADAMAVDRLFTRSRGLYSMAHHYQPPRCQAEGCQADLSGAKHYHRRHKVCEFHAKASVVVTGGVHQRFCQQCSRFHVLAEFDDAKRSCRKRLAEHNRRRRKPQITTIGDPTALKNPTTNSTENCNGNPNHSTSSKSGTCSISESRTRLEGDEGHRMKATAQLRNGAALSLGGVGDVESWPQSVYQHSHNINQQHLCFSSPSSPSTTYFNNQSSLLHLQ